ncbi:TetR/AcrR family transcriptional regulator [Streptomyces sp. NPDC056835]|uniref:TetR/AcrR family transcriptional regulator n=1 Tax=Streptomyces sp. NPDC056835 TaxID=3345956 RepID=UPI0036B31E98
MATGSGARPLRADAARNRRSVIDAARDAFARHGVTASLDDIARAAGVGPGTLYRHFPGRDELALAVMEDGLTELHRLGVELLDEPDRLKAVHRWLDAYIEQSSMYEGLARTLASPPAAADEHSVCWRAIEVGMTLIRGAAESGALRAETDAEDVRAMAVAIAWADGALPPDSDRRARLLRMLLDGISPH